MIRPASLLAAFALWSLFWFQSAKAADVYPATNEESKVVARRFQATGKIVLLLPERLSVVIRHETISNYMAGMTMPFNIKNTGELSGLSVGDTVSFRLNVNDTESWVDQIRKTGGETPPRAMSNPSQPGIAPALARSSIFSCKFTNEFGQAVSLDDFRGQALAITFFYTRCPLPDYCPRLSKNFQSAMKKLKATANAPTNWHFLSVTIDPLLDTPAMLRNYALNYDYDPAHWSFLTGAPEKIEELARGSGVSYRTVDGSIDHNFRTLIVDTQGHLQMVYPIGGDLSDSIAEEILSALAHANSLHTGLTGQHQ